MPDSAEHCSCGRELEAGETKCPSCFRADESWWKQAGALAGMACLFLGGIAIRILSGGKIKPNV
jgi:hypothetical protein